MPIAERLRALDEPAPDIDLDRALGDVRRRARKHRRVRGALVSGAAVVLAVAAGVGLLAQDGSDESQVDTVDGAESEQSLDTLVALLLDDDAVLQVVPELVPKTDYSTGESYGRVADEELVGPTAGAVAGVVRQWSLDSGTVGAGVPRGSPSGAGEEVTDGPTVVVSTVVQFPTADAATEAADAVLGLLPGQGTDLGESPVRGETTDVEMDFSDGVAVTTTGPFLVAVQVGFAGEADRSVLTGLADAVATRVASVADASDVEPGDLASFCAVAPDSPEEVPETYVGSAEQVEDLRMLRTAAPAELHAELDLLIEHFDGAVDPADPDSQLVENFPADVAAAIGAVTAYVDDNCGT